MSPAARSGSGSAWTMCHPAARMWASVASRIASGVTSGTSRKPTTAVAVGEIAFLALSPTAPTEKPRRLIAGRAILSASGVGCPSVQPRSRSFLSCSSTGGAAARAARAVSPNGPNELVDPGDEDVAVGVAHGGDETRELHPGVGRPVAVVPRVERDRRAVGGHLDRGHAADAVDHLGQPGLVHGAVAEDPQIGREQVAVRAEDLRHVRRSAVLPRRRGQLDVDARNDP